MDVYKICTPKQTLNLFILYYEYYCISDPQIIIQYIVKYSTFILNYKNTPYLCLKYTLN